MKYAICNELFEGWPLDKTAAFVADLGYHGLELAPFTLCELVTDLSSAQRRTIRRTIENTGPVCGRPALAARAHQRLSAEPSRPGRPRPHRAIPARPDRLLRRTRRRRPHLRLAPAARHPVRPRARRSLEIDRRDSCTLAACEHSKQGVIFCIEPLSSNETNFIVNVDEAADLVRRVDQPGLQMMVDVKAMSNDPAPPSRSRSATCIPSSTMSI